MKTLTVPFLPAATFDDELSAVSNALCGYKPNGLDFELWPGNESKPEVDFYIAYGTDAIFLKFSVKETYFRAIYQQTNQPVYKDSCVEFFISFDNGNNYYNLEFNALGTAYAAYGSPGERALLDAALVETINFSAQHKIVEDALLPHEWELTLTIPFNLFCKHNITTLKDKSARANFYKCGDDLPEPHFLCWNNIIAETPNFHLPQYFGQLNFE
jgi:hypothetical protein